MLDHTYKALRTNARNSTTRILLGMTLALAIFRAIGAQAESPACVDRAFETSRFKVCAFDAHTQYVRLAWRDALNSPLRSFARLKPMLGTSEHRVRFAMNAGMFDAQGTPIGLFVENGHKRVSANLQSGTGNFYLKPNGIFWIGRNQIVSIETTEQYVERAREPLWATQSGPMLVIDGALNPQIAPDGPSKYIRNAVGVLDPQTALFVISDDPVSFGRMARFFRDALGCRDALYLDGAVSSLWVPAIDRRDDQYRLGPMVVVLDR